MNTIPPPVPVIVSSATRKQAMIFFIAAVLAPIIFFSIYGLLYWNAHRVPVRSAAEINKQIEADFTAAVTKPPTTQVQQGVTEACQEMEKQGMMRFDHDARKAWVNPLFWLRMDAEQKETTTRAIAIYVSPQNPMVTIYDKQSGRELASYGPFQGFKVTP